MSGAFLNRIETAVPPHDVHRTFVAYAGARLADARRQTLLRRMTERAQIEHRWSVLRPAESPETSAADAEGFYTPSRFPSTAQRMQRYEREAGNLVVRALDKFGDQLEPATVTHLLVASCTGHYAPGLDLEIVERCGLPRSVERTMLGFMGCHAGLAALRLARHIVRSEPDARVLVVCLELCTLHLQDTDELDELLSFALWGDGCAAAMVSGRPAGLALQRFHTLIAPAQQELVTWRIEDSGFAMFLSPRLPAAVTGMLRLQVRDILGNAPPGAITHWAVHPGGRSILDGARGALDLAPEALAHSRAVLADYGNMSSATVLFVLERVMGTARRGERGCALAFGPGLSAESALFEAA
ncbi:MAG: type III polyketide synthase [Acetobacterales bacterium]